MERDRLEASTVAVQSARVEGVTRIHGSRKEEAFILEQGAQEKLLRRDHSVEALLRVFQEGKENRAFQVESTVCADRGGKKQHVVVRKHNS